MPIWRTTLSAPLFRLVTYDQVRAYVAIRAKLQESRSKERLSFGLRAVAPFPHKACSPVAPLCGDSDSRGAFAFCIQMARFSDKQPERAYLSTTHIFSETELRAAKPNFHRGCFAPALESRGADLRPRKLDEHLNRDVAHARRVALLAPRATFSEYCSPLGYVSARLTLFSRGVFIKTRIAPL